MMIGGRSKLFFFRKKYSRLEKGLREIAKEWEVLLSWREQGERDGRRKKREMQESIKMPPPCFDNDQLRRLRLRKTWIATGVDE